MEKDIYFYKGKFYTELGLKRVLSKEGRIWYSRGTFYLYKANFEYYYDRQYFKDLLHDNDLITDEELKHFQKWINAKVRSGEISVLKGHTFYHCEENDGMGGDWDEALEALKDSYYNKENAIQTDEEIIEEYCDKALTDEQFEVFSKLPDCRQFAIARKWKLEEWGKSK